MISVFELEKHLIDPQEWDSLYPDIPDYVQQVKDDLSKNPACVGIGKHSDVGWFVLGAGQGPHILWQENDCDLIHVLQK